MTPQDQPNLFGEDVLSELDHWRGMPEFTQRDLAPYKQLTVSFANWEDYQAFSALVDQPLTADTRSIWFPAQPIGRYADKVYVDTEPERPAQ